MIKRQANIHYLIRRCSEARLQLLSEGLAAIVVRMVALARTKDWEPFLELYRQLLAWLYGSDTATQGDLGSVISLLATLLPHELHDPLVAVLSTQEETTHASVLLANSSSSVSASWRERVCCCCRKSLHELREVKCSNKKCIGGGSVCSKCTDSWQCKMAGCNRKGKAQPHRGFARELTNAIGQCSEISCPGQPEVLIIESTVLAASGHSLLAVTLLQAVMSSEGIDWCDPGSREALLRWLRLEFFDSPEQLKAVMELLATVKNMEWISQLIKQELAEHPNLYRNDGQVRRMQTRQGSGKGRIDRFEYAWPR